MAKPTVSPNRRRFQEWFENIPSTPGAEAVERALALALAAEAMRHKLGWSYAELARRMGVSRAYVHKMLQGSENSTLHSLCKLARALDCELVVELAPKNKKPVCQARPAPTIKVARAQTHRLAPGR